MRRTAAAVALLAALVHPAIRAQAPAGGGWVRDSSRADDGTRSYALSLRGSAHDSVAGWPAADLLVSCTSARAAPFVSIVAPKQVYAVWFRRDRHARVRTQLDQAPEASTMWVVTRDFRSLSPPRGSLPSPDQWPAGSTLRVALPVSADSSASTIFRLPPLADQLPWLTAACRGS